MSHVDVLPTLLELAGHRPPRSAQGIALGPFLRRRRADSRPGRLLRRPWGRECVPGGPLLSPQQADFARHPSTPSPVGGYRWDTSGTLSPTPDALPLAQGDPRPTCGSEVPRCEIEPVDREDARHLRALGYVESRRVGRAVGCSVSMMISTMFGGAETTGGAMGGVRPTRRPATTAGAFSRPVA